MSGWATAATGWMAHSPLRAAAAPRRVEGSREGPGVGCRASRDAGWLCVLSFTSGGAISGKLSQIASAHAARCACHTVRVRRRWATRLCSTCWARTRTLTCSSTSSSASRQVRRFEGARAAARRAPRGGLVAWQAARVGAPRQVRHHWGAWAAARCVPWGGWLDRQLLGMLKGRVGASRQVRRHWGAWAAARCVPWGGCAFLAQPTCLCAASHMPHPRLALCRSSRASLLPPASPPGCGCRRRPL